MIELTRHEFGGCFDMVLRCNPKIACPVFIAGLLAIITVEIVEIAKGNLLFPVLIIAWCVWLLWRIKNASA